MASTSYRLSSRHHHTYLSLRVRYKLSWEAKDGPVLPLSAYKQIHRPWSGASPVSSCPALPSIAQHCPLPPPVRSAEGSLALAALKPLVPRNEARNAP